MGITDYRVTLAAEVISDIEQQRVPIEPLLYKARRLMNVVGDVQAEEWLGYELAGYPPEVPTAFTSIVRRVGREVVSAITAAEVAAAELRAVASPDIPIPKLGEPRTSILREGLPRIEHSVIPSLNDAQKHNAGVLNTMQRRAAVGAPSTKQDQSVQWERSVGRTQQQLLRYVGIGKGVRAEIHRLAVAAHHRFRFSDVATAVFEKHKLRVDARLAATAGEVLDKLPAIYDRLTAGVTDPEALSHAMTSCRRMISAFAESAAPANEMPAIDDNGAPHSQNRGNYLNRIEALLREKCESKSRRERLTRTLRLLHDRVSAGVKADVSAAEAQDLFLLTYLVLGEIAEVTTDVAAI